MRKRTLCLVLLTMLGVTTFAYESSVSIDVRWRVLPYQSLTVVGSGSDADLLALPLSSRESATSASGAVEASGSLRFHVASNVPWKLQVRLAGSDSSPDIKVRRGAGEFLPLSERSLLVASGPHGVYDVTLDVFLPQGDAAERTQLVATIMPE
jgi:hypothetical protein